MNGHKELTVAHKHSEVEWVEVEEVYTYTLFLQKIEVLLATVTRSTYIQPYQISNGLWILILIRIIYIVYLAICLSALESKKA